jgi:hypothetical protein
MSGAAPLSGKTPCCTVSAVGSTGFLEPGVYKVTGHLLSDPRVYQLEFAGLPVRGVVCGTRAGPKRRITLEEMRAILGSYGRLNRQAGARAHALPAHQPGSGR